MRGIWPQTPRARFQEPQSARRTRCSPTRWRAGSDSADRSRLGSSAKLRADRARALVAGRITILPVPPRVPGAEACGTVGQRPGLSAAVPAQNLAHTPSSPPWSPIWAGAPIWPPRPPTLVTPPSGARFGSPRYLYGGAPYGPQSPRTLVTPAEPGRASFHRTTHLTEGTRRTPGVQHDRRRARWREMAHGATRRHSPLCSMSFATSPVSPSDGLARCRGRRRHEILVERHECCHLVVLEALGCPP